MADKDTIICRCEDLTRQEVREYIAAGFTTVEDIKRVSRCGMGPCQGDTCHQLLVREIADITGQQSSEIAPAVARPPVKGIKLGALLKGEETDG